MKSTVDPLLTVCICTMPGRENLYNRMVGRLHEQLKFVPAGSVEVLCEPGCTTQSDKMNKMQQAARGKYICSVDDDDQVSRVYLMKILPELERNPDAVTFTLLQYTNDVVNRRWIFSKQYKDKTALTGDKDLPAWGMHINQLTPVRTTLARRVPWFDLPRAADQLHSKIILMEGWIKRTRNVSTPAMYHYMFRTDSTAQQTGSKQSKLNELKPRISLVYRAPDGTYLLSGAGEAPLLDQHLNSFHLYSKPECTFIGEVSLQ